MNILRKSITWLYQRAGEQTATAYIGGSPHVMTQVSEERALGLTTVFACTRVLAQTVGSLPIHVYKRPADLGDRTRSNHYLESILNREPSIYTTRVEYMEAMMTALALWGNAYSLIGRNDAGQVVSLIPIHPGKVAVRRTDDDILYQIHTSSGPQTLTSRDILHVRGFGFDGVMGLPPIGTCRQSLGLAVSAEEYGAKWFNKGAHPSGLLTASSPLTPQQSEEWGKRFTELYSGAANVGSTVVIGSDMKFTPLSMPLKDSQFIEIRRFQAEEVARMMGVQPHLVGILDRSTNNNIEHQGIEAVTYTFRPYLTRFEQAFNKALFTPAEKGKYFVEFSIEGLLRGDAKSRGDFYRALFNLGAISPNMICDLENFPRFEGGDIRMVPLNMQRLQDVGKPRSN